jgi:preprotein translocase subunit SecA
MDHLRDGIWTMDTERRNPLVEYKIEGSRIFSNMLLNMKEEIIEYMMKVEVRKVRSR